MGGEIEKIPDGDLKHKAASWLFSQGVSTVLLFAICVALYVQAPRIAERIQASQETQVDRITKSFDADQERDARVLEAVLKATGVSVSGPAAPSLSSRP